MKTKIYTKQINIPELKEFAITYPQFAGLTKGEGKFLFDIVMKPETFIQAMILTEYGIKQFIGAMIASLMAANGYKKSGRKKSIIHRAYTRGEFYIKK